MSVPAAKLSQSKLEIRPLTGALGAEIFNADLANLDDAGFAVIHKAFLDYSAVIFHDVHLTQEQFAAFGQRFHVLGVQFMQPCVDAFGQRIRGEELPERECRGREPARHAYAGSPARAP